MRGPSSYFFFSSRRRHTRLQGDWSSDVCSSDYNTVNILRLWAAHGTDLFDLEYFNSGDYIRSIDRAMYSENITRVLYPNDKVAVGQELRLRQEYFLASASLQDILRRYRRTQTTFDALPDKVAVQINDTHPEVAAV